MNENEYTTVTVISHHFPTERQPYLQTFIKDHVESIERTRNFQPYMLQVHPKMPPFTDRWKSYQSRLLTGKPNDKLSYFSVPAKKAPKFVARRISSIIIKSITPATNPILHIHWLYPAGLAIPALKKAGFRCALTIHGSDWFLSKNNKKLRNLYQESIHAADKVFTSGPELQQEIKELAGPDKEIVCLYNYINTQNFIPPTASKKQEQKINLDWDLDKTHALTVANLRREKGIDILLEAVLKAPANMQFHIIGQDSASDYSASIKHMAKQLNAFEKRVFLYKPVSREELINYYQAADLYITPSRIEGFNVSLLEALSCGLPSISSNTGIAENLINPKIGKIFESENSDALTNAIHEVYQKLPQYDGQNLHQAIAPRFSLNTYAQKLWGHYMEMMQ